MGKKEYTLADVERLLRAYLENKGGSYWASCKGVAVIKKAFARHKALYDLKTVMMNRLIAEKGWDEKGYESEYAKILVAYPVCTHRDHEAINELAVVISDLDRLKFSSFVGRMTQRRSSTSWAVSGLEDTLLRCQIQPEYLNEHYQKEVQQGI